MSVNEKIKMPNKEIIQPKKMGYWLKTQFINHLDIHGVMMLG